MILYPYLLSVVLTLSLFFLTICAVLMIMFIILYASLANLLNFSLSSGCFPSSWKLANVVPIPKSASLCQSPSQFRPISLLSIVSKLFEKHIHYLISVHLSIHHPLSNLQWGFQERKSTSLPCCLLRKTGLLILTSTKKFAVSSLISKRHSILCHIKGL